MIALFMAIGYGVWRVASWWLRWHISMNYPSDWPNAPYRSGTCDWIKVKTRASREANQRHAEKFNRALGRRQHAFARVLERLRSPPLSHGIARELRKQQAILEREIGELERA